MRAFSRARASLPVLPPDAVPAGVVVVAGADAPLPSYQLDAERRDEMEVWLVFAGAALSDPSLAAVKRDSDATMLRRIRLVVAAWSPSGTPGPELDRTAGRLRALTDGLATHLVGPYPAMEPAEARAIVADELDRLCRPHQPHQPHQPHRPHRPHDPR